MKKYILICLGLLFTHFASGQGIDLLLSNLEAVKEAPQRSELMYQVGNEYQKQGAYKKALEYFEKSLQTHKGSETDVLQKKRKIAQSYAFLKEYGKAISTNDEILEYYRTHSKEEPLIDVLNENSEYCQAANLNDKALAYNNELAKIYEKKNDLARLAQTYNNLGVVFRRQNDQNKAIEYFNKGLETSKLVVKDKKQKKETDALMLINVGVTYLQLKDYKKANNYFSEAVKLVQEQNNPKSKATAYNYAAMSSYLSDENATAFSFANQALTTAVNAKDEENQMIAYQILSQIYQSEDSYKEAQDAQNKYQELKNKLEKQRQQEIQNSLEKEVAVERKESEIKSILAENASNAAALKQSELERQKQEQELKLRENELMLLKRNQELQEARLKTQAAEQRQIRQLLELTRQKAETERQRLLAEAQSQEAERQRLLAQQRQLENETKSRDLLTAKVQQKLQTDKLRQEKYIRYLGIAIILLVAGALIFVYRGLRTTRKLNHALHEKQEEINVQNEELKQSQEEARTQRDALADANKALEKNNQDIKNSITYASRIQSAVLPRPEYFQEVFPESFILYKPRDIVSGDFYWLEEVQDKIILVVGDCTGHGVPGAFMSMLGSAGLSEIVFQQNVIEPDKILNQLHLYIRQALKQEVIRGRDGMDIGITVIDKKLGTLDYSGAKMPFLYVQNGVMEIIKGDRSPIGGEQREGNRIFTKHTINIEQSTIFYLFSDGYQDQFGEENKKNLMKKYFREVLFQVHRLPMQEQLQALADWHSAWKGDLPQTDDILVIGVKL